DKGEARTDWLKRPLSSAQLQYAAADVYYLHQIYPQMRAQITAMGRLDWLWQEGQRACRGRLTVEDPAKAYLKVKNAWQLKPEQLAVLRSLAAWRLGVAQRKDLALNFVVKDAVLLNLAKRAPRSYHYLQQLDGLDARTLQRYGKALLAAIAEADLSNLPAPIDPTGLDPDFREAVALVRSALLQVAEQNKVQPEFLASKKLVSQYVNFLWQEQTGNTPEVLQGWRGEICAEPLAQLKIC
ncbi:MAG: HRDC domain-containing protein, partial [Ferrimonas sp.]